MIYAVQHARRAYRLCLQLVVRAIERKHEFEAVAVLMGLLQAA